jgi:uncharacterized membrane protein
MANRRGKQGRRHGRAERPATPPPSRPDWLVGGLAGLGVAIAGYLAVTRLLGGSVLFCTDQGGCEVVQASRYAMFLGLPTAAWGAGLYAAVGGLALAGFTASRWLAAFVLTVVGVAFSGYLSYLELVVIGAVCGYCVVSAAIAAGLLGLVLGRRSVASRWSPLGPGRLAALGGVTAVLTVLVGIGVFAAGAPRAEAPYQDALARHLAASGAIMYGAFW